MKTHNCKIGNYECGPFLPILRSIILIEHLYIANNLKKVLRRHHTPNVNFFCLQCENKDCHFLLNLSSSVKTYFQQNVLISGYFPPNNNPNASYRLFVSQNSSRNLLTFPLTEKLSR